MSENAEIAQEVAVEQETVAEEVVTEEAPVEEKGPGRSEYVTHFAAIAKKEAALQDIAKQAKATRAENEQLRQEIEQIKAARGLAKTDPVKFLQESGLTMEELLHQDLNGDLPVETKLSRRIEALEKQNADLLKQREEEMTQREAKKEETEWKSFVDQVTEFVDNDSSYELIRAGGMQWMVPQLMREFYQKQGQQITATQAANLVEESLEESLEGYLKAEKLQKKYGLKELTSESQDTPVDDAGEVEPARKAQQKPKTLTNQLVSGTSEKETGMLSREQSLDRIARMLDAAR
tara:strand:+ start:54 stop:929 length:876 start_codon:yes stop_codon:yes gene_type:complete